MQSMLPVVLLRNYKSWTQVCAGFIKILLLLLFNALVDSFADRRYENIISSPISICKLFSGICVEQWFSAAFSVQAQSRSSTTRLASLIRKGGIRLQSIASACDAFLQASRHIFSKYRLSYCIIALAIGALSNASCFGLKDQNSTVFLM